MNSKNVALGVCMGAVWLPTALHAQLFSDSLQSSSSASSWTVDAAPLTSGTPFDYQANFGFDYSTVGVPQDPYAPTASTTALQLKINETSGEQAGVSASPTSLSLAGNFTLSFDMWLNYNSGGFTTGSTQVGSYGLTTSASQVQWAGIANGQLFGIVTDNGSSTTYRGYNGGSSIGAAPFAAGSQSYANAYYTSLFPSVSVPATETAVNANQSGSTAAGTAGFRWLQVSVTSLNGTLSESINGKLIASYSSASLGSDIFLGMYDINNGSAGVSGAADENFTLFDNVVVTAPEPGTMALAVMGGAGWLLVLRRRRTF